MVINEWNEMERGLWDWFKNKVNVIKFFEEGIVCVGKNEFYFIIGMRGLGDEVVNIQNVIEMFKDVFKVQWGIIKKFYGFEMVVNQVWVLYKEVVLYYDVGLDLDGDIMLLFLDDNQGNVYCFLIGNEIEWLGGIGVYFYFEYVGLLRFYKWYNINNLGKVYKELLYFYLRGVNRIWIMNVGDIKLMELLLNLVMDLVWDVLSILFDSIL